MDYSLKSTKEKLDQALADLRDREIRGYINAKSYPAVLLKAKIDSIVETMPITIGTPATSPPVFQTHGRPKLPTQ